jgi:hypothetical protein
MQGKELVGLHWEIARKIVTLFHRRKREDRTWSGSITTVNRETALLMPLLLTCCSVKVRCYQHIPVVY